MTDKTIDIENEEHLRTMANFANEVHTFLEGMKIEARGKEKDTIRKYADFSESVNNYLWELYKN